MSLLLDFAAKGLKGVKKALRKKANQSKPSAADSVVTTKTRATPFTYERERTVAYDHSPGTTVAASPGCAMVLRPGGGFRATRLNKSTYVTRGGGTSKWPQQLIVHEKGTECVTVRRRHVTNAKALRRAISRVRGFVKTYRKAAALVGHRRSTRGGRCTRCGRNPCSCK